MMELPSFLSDKLHAKLKSVTDSTQLMEILIKEPNQGADFFIQASEDLMWIHQHEEVMKKLLANLTDAFLRTQLSMQKAKMMAAVLQKNYNEFLRIMEVSFILRVEEEEFPIQGLLFGSSSDAFRIKAFEKYMQDKIEVIHIPTASPANFSYLLEFIKYGQVENLWKADQKQLIEIIRLANRWSLYELKYLCEERLTHYVDRTNLLDMLKFSTEKELYHLQKTCVKILNRFENDVQVYQEEKGLIFTFYKFNLRSLEIFEQLKEDITHLVCQGDLLKDSVFENVVNQIPRLAGLDLSQTPEFSEHVFAIPPKLKELNLSSCPWLNLDILNRIIEICPKLSSLKLNRNDQLPYQSWTLLQKLPQLLKLEIADSIYLKDNELGILVNSCSQLEVLNLSGCSQLSRQAFFELAHTMTNLRELDLKKCNIDDSALLEIAYRCRELSKLNISYNMQISLRGLMQVLKACPNLKVLDLTLTSISQQGIQDLLEVRPDLNIILRS